MSELITHDIIKEETPSKIAIWRKLCRIESDIASLVIRFASVADILEDLALGKDSDDDFEEEEEKE